MLEQQVGGTVQAYRGLAGTGAALHHQALVERGTDHHVLFGLDGGHHLAHGAGAGSPDLGQHRVGYARARRLVIRVVELLVEVCGELTRPVLGGGDRETPSVRQPERIGVGCAVERRGDGRPPIDHHRVVGVVLDVAAADVPAVVRLVDDAAEEVAGTGRAQVFQRLGHRHLDVLLGDLVGCTLRVERGEALDHAIATRAREHQLCLLGGQVGEQVGAHRVCHPIERARVAVDDRR